MNGSVRKRVLCVLLVIVPRNEEAQSLRVISYVKFEKNELFRNLYLASAPTLKRQIKYSALIELEKVYV